MNLFQKFQNTLRSINKSTSFGGPKVVPLPRLNLVFFLFSIFYILSSAHYASALTSVSTSNTNLVKNGLVGHWTFDGKNMTNTTALDISGGANNGTLTNMTQASAKTPGKIGQGLKFDGVDDYVSIANNANLNGSQGTWLFWVKKGGVPSGNGYVSLGKTDVSGSYNGMNFYHFSSSIGIQIKGATDVGSYASNIGSLADSNWHHVAVSYVSGGALRIYFDGSLVVSTTSPTFTISSQNLRIGRSVDSYWETYNGSIDDLRIYSRVLSSAEVQALYKVGGGVSVAESQTPAKQNVGINSGLVGHWTLDGANLTNTTALDTSGNGRTGTLTNMSASSSKDAGKIGQGLRFDGADDYISIPYTGINYERTQPITISAWVKLNDFAPVGGYQTIFGRIIPGNRGTTLSWCKNTYAPFCTSNTFMFYMAGAIGGIAVTATGTPGVWTHIVATYDGSSSSSGVRIYINGMSKTFVTNISTLNGSIVGTTDWRIGDDTTSDHASGIVDDVRFYNRAISASEAQALYKAGGGAVTAISQTNNNRTGINSGLVGHWTFDGKNMTSTAALDSSGNNRTGTLTNMTQASSKTPGKLGQGLRFDGTNDYISIPYTGIDYERTQPITISTWVKLNNVVPAGGFQTIFGRLFGAGPSTGTFLAWCKNAVTNICNANSFSFYLANNWVTDGVVVSSPANSAPANIWTHVVVTYSGNSNVSGLKIYKNGINQPLTIYSNNLVSSITGTTNWRIGDDYTADYASGNIDDVRFYNRELTVKEVQALYKLGTQ